MEKVQKLLVIIPSFNEEKNIARVIKEIKQEMPWVDIISVDDGSTDNTARVVCENGGRCIRLPFNMGYSKALQTGYKFAATNGYSHVLQMDADGQHIASEAKKLIEHAEATGADVVIGSRYLEDTGYRGSKLREFGTRFFGLLIKMATGKKIADSTSGFQVISRRVFEKYANGAVFPEYPDANLILGLIKKGCKVEEIAVKMRLNETGGTMHSGVWKPIRYMVLMAYSILIVLCRKEVW